MTPVQWCGDDIEINCRNNNSSLQEPCVTALCEILKVVLRKYRNLLFSSA